MTPQIKTCFVCGISKPITDFYKHSGMKDGRLNKCKECTKKDVRLNRRSNIDYYRAYDRERGNRLTKDDTRDARKRHPQWLPAHNAVARAKRKGILVQGVCEVCGDKNTHAHHEDYSKPLDVIWLCPARHRWIHM